MVVKSDGLKTKDLYKTIHKASKLKAQKYNKKKWRYVQKQLKKSKKILITFYEYLKKCKEAMD